MVLIGVRHACISFSSHMTFLVFKLTEIPYTVLRNAESNSWNFAVMNVLYSFLFLLCFVSVFSIKFLVARNDNRPTTLADFLLWIQTYGIVSIFIPVPPPPPPSPDIFELLHEYMWNLLLLAHSLYHGPDIIRMVTLRIVRWKSIFYTRDTVRCTSLFGRFMG